MIVNNSKESIPKTIKSGPKIIYAFLLLIVIVAWVPHLLSFVAVNFWQFIFAILLFPLGFEALFLSYLSGLSFAKFNYKQVKAGNFFNAYVALILLHILCIVACLLFEFAITGYPFNMCANACIPLGLSDALPLYAGVVTVLLLPGYYAVYHYRSLIFKYNLKDPKNA